MNPLQKDFERFLATRDLSASLHTFFKEQEQVLTGTFYRGLPFPKHLLQVGAVIDQWHESTHWTTLESVAQSFADDYINEDYYESLQEELGLEDVPFACLVLVATELPGTLVEPYLNEFQITGYRSEQEITVVDYDFKIEAIEEHLIKGEIYHYATVSVVA